MPRHRFLVPPGRMTATQVAFSPEQARQLAGVLRLRVGDRVRVFDGRTPLDREATLTLLGRDEAIASIGGSFPQPAEPRRRLVAYPALLPRDRFEQVLQKLVEVGAAAIVPVATERALVPDALDEGKRRRWERIVAEATEQCGRGVVPALSDPLPFDHAVARAAAEGAILLAYPAVRRRRVVEAVGATGDVAAVGLFTGPEGGFTEGEVKLALARGAQLVSLGPRILRSETAAPIFVALALQALGEM